MVPPPTPRTDDLQPALGLRSASTLVLGTVIGVGIFTSTGFQAAALPHPGWILLLWIVGGVLAFCGALCYAELGASLPEAGGEYVYLREAYGQTLAFASAIVSLVAGFSAPIAAVLKSFMRYATHFLPRLADDPTLAGLPVNDLLAILLVWGLVAVHARGLRGGMGFHDIVTLLKVAAIVILIVAAAAFGKGQIENIAHVAPSFHDMTATARAGAFATSLVFVMFCYSGYNAAAYMASEVDRPQRNLPLAMVAGTGLVILLYLGLNLVYLYGADVEGLAGHVEVGLVAARQLFGETGTTLVAAMLLVTLLSAASAMTVAGPRVYYAMGRDLPRLGFLARVSPRRKVPVSALVLQGVVTTLIVLTGTVDQIQQYVGIVLTLFASLAVAAVWVLRRKRPDAPRPFRAWAYPLTPLLFLGVSGWMLIWNVRERPIESLLALATVAVAVALGARLRRPTQRAA